MCLVQPVPSRRNGPATLVCGGRDYVKGKVIWEALDRIAPRAVVHGGARGADRWASEWAQYYDVVQYSFPADWSTGRGAGPARNLKMARFLIDTWGRTDAIVLAAPGKRGTANMCEVAAAFHLTTVRITDDEAGNLLALRAAGFV